MLMILNASVCFNYMDKALQAQKYFNLITSDTDPSRLYAITTKFDTI